MRACDEPPEIKTGKHRPAESDLTAALDMVLDSTVKLSPQVFIRKIKSEFDLSTRDAKKILNRLIQDQELCYQYHFGATYIEKSFLKPVQVTDHFILKPITFKNSLARFGQIEILIEQGISFGSGQHPTTRLCLEAIEYCFFEKPVFKQRRRLISADVGTGSGVLAIAMCKAGIKFCRAYEIDPVSVHEAKKNIVHNTLASEIELYETFMPENPDSYDVVCANLRYPTLKQLSDLFHASLKENGIAILSGVREWEKEDLMATFSSKGFEPIWQKDDKNWSGFVLRKKMC